MSKSGFKYYTAVRPPAPYANVTVSAPGTSAAGLRVPAHLDTGAFVTVIPLGLAAPLGLVQVREVRAEGLDGTVVLMPTFLIELTIDGLSPMTVEALASAGEPTVLLGRDVLNRYQILLNGPAQEVTITEP